MPLSRPALLGAVALVAGSGAVLGSLTVLAPLGEPWVAEGIAEPVSIASDGRHVAVVAGVNCKVATPSGCAGTLSRLHAVDLATRESRLLSDDPEIAGRLREEAQHLGGGWLLIQKWPQDIAIHMGTGETRALSWPPGFTPHVVHAGWVYGKVGERLARVLLPVAAQVEILRWEPGIPLTNLTVLRAAEDRVLLRYDPHGMGLDRVHAVVNFTTGGETRSQVGHQSYVDQVLAMTSTHVVTPESATEARSIVFHRVSDGTVATRLEPASLQRFSMTDLTSSDHLWVVRAERMDAGLRSGELVLAGTPEGVLVELASDTVSRPEAIAAGKHLVYIENQRLLVASPLDPKPVWPFIAGGVAVVSGALAAWAIVGMRRLGEGGL